MSDSGGGAFSITDAEINFAGVLAFACTIPGTCICFLVLVAYAAAACFSKARLHLDRVSFRLLIYTLIFNVLFGIAYAATPTSPGPGCNFGAFAVNFTLSFSTFFTTCIAINLELVLVHGINGKMMEKYYLIGTTILSLALNVPTFALHQFGWDVESATCWYKNGDDKLRLHWIIGTQSFWIGLAATIETICSVVVVVWVYRFQRATSNLTKGASHEFSAGDRISTTRNTRSTSSSSPSKLVSQDPRYRKIIFRIALYPIVSLIVNISTVALDLNTTIHGLNTQSDFRLLVLDLIMYGVRTLAYGLLAAGDPSFINAIRVIRSNYASSGGSTQTLTDLNFATGRARIVTVKSHMSTQGEVEGQNATTIKMETEGIVADTEKQALESEDIRNFQTQL